ncbi:hypothetical protein [Pseudomonas sp. BMS12]|uniref:hypothetical protein n=1 Tax=Pseudomonas sp. BMS12 TaxID=1796033 RepID=UPI001F1FE8BF|nr:hypothetical protein [Pseudomonas sp. BMS12]
MLRRKLIEEVKDMQRNLIFTAIFSLSTLFFSQVTLAEESASFVTHKAELAQQRDSAEQQAIAKQADQQSGARDS